MSTDYDAPRGKDSDGIADGSLEDLAAQRTDDVDAAVLDVGDGEVVDAIELPDADLSGEELTVRVVPEKADEFICARCFLVQHRHRQAIQIGDQLVCSDCT